MRRRARRWELGALIALVVFALSLPLWSGPAARLLARTVESSSRHFRVQSVSIHGLRAVPENDVLQLAAIPLDTSLCGISLATVKRAVETHPWIRSATVRRRFPDMIEIRVLEREPVAALRGDELLLVTDDGMVVAPVQSGWVWDLPLLTPPHPIRLRAGTPLADPATRALFRETLTARAVSEELWRNLSEVYMSGGAIHATLAHPAVDLVIGERATELGWAAALAVISRRVAAPPQSIDLRFPGRVVVLEHTPKVEEQVRG